MKLVRLQLENLRLLPSGAVDCSQGPPPGLPAAAVRDAAALALYGRGMGEAIAPGAVECSAEAFFEAAGALYRAQWRLWRARRQPGGKLQPPRRRLYGADGAVLAQGAREVNQRVEKLTGMGCEVFLRAFAKAPRPAAAEALRAEEKRLEERAAALGRMRSLMNRREAAAAEGLSLSSEEARLTEELELFRQQITATEEEAATQSRLLQDARGQLEELERNPSRLGERELRRAVQDARRHLATAEAANDTAAKEAQLARVLLDRTVEALKGIEARRAELRREHVADHEAFVRLAQALRVYTPESLAEAEAALQRQREAHARRA